MASTQTSEMVADGIEIVDALLLPSNLFEEWCHVEAIDRKVDEIG
jgi:hypothetical protein